MNRSLLILAAFSILFISSPSFAQLSEMRIVGTPKEEPGELISKTMLDANSEVCAGVIIYSDLTGLSFNSVNGIVKRNSKAGQDFLFLSPDERMIEIFCSGYTPLKIILNDIGVRLKSGQTWSMKVTGDKKNRDGKGTLEIKTEPSEAQILIDEYPDYKGTSPIKLQNYPVGDYTVRIKKDKYFEIDTVLSIKKDQIITDKIVLIPQYGYLEANSSLGSRLFIDGAERQLAVCHEVGLGKKVIRITKNKYFDYDTTIFIGPNDDRNRAVRLNVGMRPTFGYLFIKTKKDEQLSLDGNQIEANTLIELPIGKKSLKIDHPLYLSQTIPITVVSNDDRSNPITLEPLLVPNQAKINIDVTPSEAEIPANDPNASRFPRVVINGTQYTDIKEIFVPAGKANIEVSLPGYISAKKSIVIPEGKYSEMHEPFTLVPNNGKLTVSVEPEQIDVFANGQVSSVSPKITINGIDWSNKKEILLSAGPVNADVQLQGYRSEQRTLSFPEGKATVSREDINLVPLYGTLRLISTSEELADAQIIINGKVRGTLPLGDMKLVEGSYSVIARKDGHSEFSRTIVIQESKITELPLDMQKSRIITISSDPAGADIFIDGKYIGGTPKDIELDFNSHRVKLVKDEYKDLSTNLQINLDSKTTTYQLEYRDDVLKKLKMESEYLSNMYGPENGYYSGFVCGYQAGYRDEITKAYAIEGGHIGKNTSLDEWREYYARQNPKYCMNAEISIQDNLASLYVEPLIKRIYPTDYGVMWGVGLFDEATINKRIFDFHLLSLILRIPIHLEQNKSLFLLDLKLGFNYSLNHGAYEPKDTLLNGKPIVYRVLIDPHTSTTYSQLSYQPCEIKLQYRHLYFKKIYFDFFVGSKYYYYTPENLYKTIKSDGWFYKSEVDAWGKNGGAIPTKISDARLGHHDYYSGILLFYGVGVTLFL
jgi:hypothetical protein